MNNDPHPVFSDNRSPLQIGYASVKANLLPGFILQCLALLLVVLYFFNDTFFAQLNGLMAFRQEVGLPYSIISTIVFAGLIPFAYMQARPATRTHKPLAHCLFYLLYWGFNGYLIHVFYNFQSVLWGDTNDVQTVVLKMLFDMFVFSLMVAVPMNVITYAWKDLDFSFSRLQGYLGSAWVKKAAFPVFIANLSIWLPAVTLIYIMPTALQLPLNNIVLCFWTLMLAHISRRK